MQAHGARTALHHVCVSVAVRGLSRWVIVTIILSFNDVASSPRMIRAKDL